MPLFAWIIIGILLFIALLAVIFLLSKVQLVISYKDDFSVNAKFLFLKFKLYPEEKKKPKTKKKQAVSPTKKPTEKPKEKKKGSIIPKLFEYREVIIDIVKEFASRIHFKFVKINIKIATDDAAKTALAYSGAVQGVSYLVSFLENHSNVDMTNNSSINIYTDFLSEESELDGSIYIHTRVYHAIPVLLRIIKLITQIKLKSEDLKNGTI